jgi:5-deoxy-5-amino-3-dehydroquinate synthase
VIADVEMLATLPPKEWRCGHGEMAKYAFLGPGQPSTEILELSLEEQIAQCIEIKADVVASDERESGRRMILNYGHTLAHALEAVGLEQRSVGLDSPVSQLAHGEAVAIGVVFAANLARALGRIDESRVALHQAVVGGFDLSSELPGGLSAEALVALMQRDKKAHHDLVFALDGPDGVEPVSGVDPSVVLATLLDMGAER